MVGTIVEGMIFGKVIKTKDSCDNNGAFCQAARIGLSRKRTADVAIHGKVPPGSHIIGIASSSVRLSGTSFDIPVLTDIEVLRFPRRNKTKDQSVGEKATPVIEGNCERVSLKSISPSRRLILRAQSLLRKLGR